MAGMQGLGRLFDLASGVIPVSISGSGSSTGLRVSMSRSSACAVVLFKAAAASAADPTLTFSSYKVATSGTADHTGVLPSYYYKKAAVSYAQTTAWSKVAIATPIYNPVLTGEGLNQGIYVFEVFGDQMLDGYNWLEVDVADAAGSAAVTGLLYITHDLTVQRTPANLAAQGTA